MILEMCDRRTRKIMYDNHTHFVPINLMLTFLFDLSFKESLSRWEVKWQLVHQKHTSINKGLLSKRLASRTIDRTAT